MIKNPDGFSLTEIMVAVVVSGVVVLGGSQLFSDMNKQAGTSEKLFWVNARRAEIQNLIRNDNGFASILALNPNLNCFQTPGADCSAYTNEQDLKIPMDGSTLDGGSPSQGISSKGTLCNSFNPTTGNDACPIGISAKWQVVCEATPCQRSQPKFIVRFQEKSSTPTARNMKAFDLVMYKDAQTETVNAACVAMGGTYTAPNCVLPVLAAQCDPASGSFVLGFDALGRASCGKPVLNSCASTDLGVGFGAAGELICGAACLATDCTAQNLSWTVGAKTCAAPFARTADSASATAINTIIGNTGTATFQCTTGTWAPTPNAGATCF